MKINFKYTKGYEVRYIGHLDLMRVFERALRRSNLPLKYSEGFNPRIKLSFAMPLPVGVEGEAEFATLELDKYMDMKTFENELNAVLPVGIQVYGGQKDPLNHSLTEMVTSASYLVQFPEQIDQVFLDNVLAQDQLIYQKKSKHKFKEIDLKPNLYRCTCDGCNLFFTVKSGNELNIRPDEVLRILQPDRIPLRIVRQSLSMDK